MSLIKCGGGVTDIKGTFAGQHFKRDKSGLHCCSKQRRVYSQTAAQAKQRNAFVKARTYTRDPRWVSYYIYLALNNIPYVFDAIVTGNPGPDCTGLYEPAGTYGGKTYYERKDSEYLVWYDEPGEAWTISDTLGVPGPISWYRPHTIEGTYTPGPEATGQPIVKLELTPPPPDYKIPKL